MKFNALSGALGLRGSIDIPVGFGVVSPMARIEYRQTSQSAYDQSMYYADLGSGTSSTFSQPAGVYGMTSGALGLACAHGERAHGGTRIRPLDAAPGRCTRSRCARPCACRFEVSRRAPGSQYNVLKYLLY